jgi:hypothetical protein
MTMYKKPETLPQPLLRDKIFEITGISSTASDWESYFHYLESAGLSRHLGEIVSALCDTVEKLERQVYGTDK